MQYFGTMLPRIPVLIERKMKVQLLLHEVRGEKKVLGRAMSLLLGMLLRVLLANGAFEAHVEVPWTLDTVCPRCSGDLFEGYRR